MADVDYFLKMDGIEGESTDDKHKGEVDVLSVDLGGRQQSVQALAGGGGSGKVNVNDLSFTTLASKATPKFIEAMATGKPSKSAVFVCRKAGGEQQEYLKITLSGKIYVSNYQIAGSPANVIPVERIHLRFDKMEMEHKEQKADGTLGGAVKGGVDSKTQEKVS